MPSNRPLPPPLLVLVLVLVMVLLATILEGVKVVALLSLDTARVPTANNPALLLLVMPSSGSGEPASSSVDTKRCLAAAALFEAFCRYDERVAVAFDWSRGRAGGARVGLFVRFLSFDWATVAGDGSEETQLLVRRGPEGDSGVPGEVLDDRLRVDEFIVVRLEVEPGGWRT